MTHEDISRLNCLAVSIVASPQYTGDWVRLILAPDLPVPIPSADLQSAAQLLLWVDESKGKEEMLDYAFILESHEFEFGRRAGRALRWAVQRNLIEKCRKGPLTEEENETMMRSGI